MTTAVFNCNYNCNDDCNFCFNKDFLNKTPHMTLDEVQDNYEYIQNRFDIRNIIISGGEPSLHPDFWRLMIFFYYKIDHKIRPALNTNGILFSQEKLLKKLEKVIQLSPLPRKQISLSFSNIEDPYNPKNKKEEMKINGIRNLLGANFGNTRIFLSVIITRENYKNLGKIAEYIKSSINGKNKKFLHIDIRYVFIGSRKMSRDKENAVFLKKEDYKEVMPESFQEARGYIEEFIASLNSANISLSLKNIPICNLSTDIQSIHFSEYKGEKRIGVSALCQKEGIDVPGDYFTDARKPIDDLNSCKNCSRNQECAIEKEYIELDIFDRFCTIYAQDKKLSS